SIVAKRLNLNPQPPMPPGISSGEALSDFCPLTSYFLLLASNLPRLPPAASAAPGSPPSTARTTPATPGTPPPAAARPGCSATLAPAPAPARAAPPATPAGASTPPPGSPAGNALGLVHRKRHPFALPAGPGGSRSG